LAQQRLSIIAPLLQVAIDRGFFLGWQTELEEVCLKLGKKGGRITAKAVPERAPLTTDRQLLAERFPSVAIFGSEVLDREDAPSRGRGSDQSH
jgi:hypothetical protein